MESPTVDLKQSIKEEAHRLGFALVGLTTGEPLPHAQVFESWLGDGKHGEMDYLATPRARQCRAYPQSILPECCSVLALGLRYPTAPPIRTEITRPPEMRGKIASYAWGVDYHAFLPARLEALVGFIETRVGKPIPNRWYTDTGPILERDVAQRAGLGWIGKNTCLINPRQGSYFLLAEILLGIELEPDQPFSADHCGTCKRCIQACPTGCILPDRTLDARRCISYLTIELKDSIPIDLRPLMDRWAFGCDVCQQVCPWNRFATSTADPAFGHRLVEPEPDLLNELAISTNGFNQAYRHSPLRRAKRRGYLRNIAVALGNLRHPDAIEPLIEVLETEPEPLVRAHVAWALGEIGSTVARQALQNAKDNENDPYVLLEIEKSLAKLI
jgi:epoxyqueuosine reductase